MNTPTTGIIYFATHKEHYVDQAIQSARSIKEHAPHLQIAISTNLETYAANAGCFDHILSMRPHHDETGELLFIDKLQCFIDSPFDHTLYLDADTYVFDDLGDLFSLLSRFQIVVTFGHHRHIRDKAARGLAADHKGRKRQIIDDTLPRAFAPIQGGFLLYRKSDPRVMTWLQHLMQRYKDNNFYDDQVAIRQMLWEASDLSIYALPEEYNFTGLSTFRRWQKSGFKIARPVILHYTAHKKNPRPAIAKIQKQTRLLREIAALFKKAISKMKIKKAR